MNCSIPVTKPALQWYFAEGAAHLDSSKGQFSTWICLQNPSTITAATCTVTFMDCYSRTHSIRVTVPAEKRYSIDLGYELQFATTPIDESQISTTVVSTNDMPVIAERSMYWDYGGHRSIGAPELNTLWFCAEGSTQTGFQEWITIVNPNDSAAEVDVTYYFTDGTTASEHRDVAATARETIPVHDPHVDDNGSVIDVTNKMGVSAKVQSTNGVGTLVERSIYTSTVGHNSIAATTPTTIWYFPEGYTANGFTQYLCLQNPYDEDAECTISYMVKGETTPREFYVTVEANSRHTQPVNNDVSGKELSTKVESTNGVKIIAERVMYSATAPEDAHCSRGIIY